MAQASTGSATSSTILDEQLARQHHRREQYARHLHTTQQLKDEWDQLSRGDGQPSFYSGIDYSDLLGTAQDPTSPLLDIGTAHRALVRSRFKPAKAAEVVIDGLRARARHALDEPAPDDEYARLQAYAASDSPLFAFLDPERCVDRLGRPVAVLTLRSISSDLAREREIIEQEPQVDDAASDDESDMSLRANLSGRSRPEGPGASNDGLREWCWWISELARRVLSTHYPDDSGVGCVLLVDAKGAGIKDLELELLPHLINVNHNHFPGLFESVFVINYSWAHSGLWSCIRRVLPQAALDKIQFMRRQEIQEIFDLKTLPATYGGEVDGFGPEARPGEALRRLHAVEHLGAQSASEEASVCPTPIQSRRQSISSSHATPEQQDLPERYRKANSRLQMTKLEISTSNLTEGDAQAVEDATVAEPASALQRIRSLGDFRLYLSPSRRTHIEILLGSDDEMSDHEGEESASRPRRGSQKAASPNGMPRAPRDERSRTYSANLQEHHARALSETRERLQQQAATMIDAPTTVEERPGRRVALPISAYDRMHNPMFGYPAVQSYANGSVEPQYGRKRKRDLVKTLLFLFLLRMASLRTWIGQAMTDFFAGIVSHVLFLGIPAHKLFGAVAGQGRIQHTPETAFALAQRRRSKEADQDFATGEWMWLLMVLLVLRGAWGRASLGDWDVWRRIKGTLSRG